VSGFSAPFGPGPLPSLGAFISPWSFLNATGIDSTMVNGYEQALLFEAQVPEVPEPSTVLLVGSGLLVALRLRRKRAWR
jgi:hypothetical protein